MMAGCLPAGSCAARIMLFAGGPPTVGSGKVVDMELLEPIRQAHRQDCHAAESLTPGTVHVAGERMHSAMTFDI